MTFKSLHTQDAPLLVCNVWDVASSKIAEKLGFQAIGTSSAAIATLLGYKDGENISFSELSFIVKRILDNTQCPLTVDIESGYSREPSDIANHIKALANLGVAGVNLEDSIVEKERKLLDAEQFANTISAIKEILKKDGVDLFLNVRTDTFLLNPPNAAAETEKRIQLYEKSGAEGIFIPGIEKKGDIKNVIDYIKLPVNVMCMPNLPDFKKLKELGVKRISMGNFLFDHMYNGFEKTLKSVIVSQSFKPVF